MGRLDDRIALITGAGAGLGRAMALRIASEGAFAIVTDIDGPSAEAVAAQIHSRGGRASAHVMDVTRGQDVDGLLRQVALDHKRLDILVSNAGLSARSEVRHLSDADWVRLREVNLDGVMRLARDGFELLRASGRGSLIHISSMLASRSLRPLAAYSATKGAVNALTRGLAVEYAPFKIRVNAVAPGFIETQMTNRLTRVPQIRKSLVDRTPLGRFGTPEDVANAVVFLASDEAAFITGAVLAVDGGMSVHA